MKVAKKSIHLISFFFFIILFSTIWNFDNSAAFETIATFLSITIGFTITSLSIIATSKFSRVLYKTEDGSDNSKTLLHVLIGLFRTSTLIFIATIGLILVYKFFPEACFKKPIIYLKTYTISLRILLKSIIWYLTILSFYYFLYLFEKFAKFVIKTATHE